MFKTREEESILRKHRRQLLLKMFKETLMKVLNLKQNELSVNVTAMFQPDCFQFDITVFTEGGLNTSLMVYDFWEIQKCQSLVDAFMSAAKTGDFEKVKAVNCRA
ncbi:hypothetical protein UFOVP1419_4 [uncultured Caudovirales phage]|uniref:Uncharacterized protein n=1 Tax=uncultured Caudovirales phage TaxID=2100421 RepID=A0A6J5SDK2_9CAUD|nr:hypothetical protein UFOVP1419_4 [uncultured Caudovirales phage]